MKLSLDTVKNKVFQNSLETCEYIDGFENTSSTITVRCKIHDVIFATKYENVRRDNRPHHICPECQKEDKDNKYSSQRAAFVCDYCGKEFTVALSKAEKSKSGLHFCCREHKDLAQRLDSGEKFDTLRPSHYGTGEHNYRDIAFREFPHKCVCCGWDEDERLLEVHHIDSNREHNTLDNLTILCPLCHRKITLGYYEYDKDNHTITKIK